MIALEEKFLVNILYRPESELLKGVDINNINFEKLITLASGHLMLPALFYNIQKKKAVYLFPEDFIDYIKNIFAINKARNEILLDEAKELSELLVKNNIKHIFLKGTALLLSNVFEDIGERMMCDIDLIIRHKDEEKIKKVLEKNKYFSRHTGNLYDFFKSQHLPRLLHKNKIIGIEIHTELLPALYRWVFSSKELLNDFKEVPKKNETPSQSFLFDHCIYGLQIDDQAFFTNHHSHRNIYDIYKLNCKNSLTTKNIKKDIYVRHFFITIEKFNIFDVHIKTTLLSSFYDKLFKITRKFVSKTYKILTKIVEILFSPAYRKYASQKIVKRLKNGLF